MRTAVLHDSARFVRSVKTNQIARFCMIHAEAISPLGNRAERKIARFGTIGMISYAIDHATPPFRGWADQHERRNKRRTKKPIGTKSFSPYGQSEKGLNGRFL